MPQTTMRRLILACGLAMGLGLAAPAAAAPSTAALHVLNAYIEGRGDCSEQLLEWNRKYNARTVSGEVSRVFYYRAIGNQEWGRCGRPYFRNIFSELQKIWLIFARGDVSQAAIEAKEDELINLMFAALAAGERGGELVGRYERRTEAGLMGLEPERQYFNCTFFAGQARCID